jgi:glycosyltransferase involved in cell wall biosynthesis
MKYNVLFLIDVLREMGGAERNLIRLASLLDSKKYNLIISCLKGGRIYEELKDKKINVHNFRVNRIYSLNGFIQGIKFIKFIKKNNIKIVVTCFESSDFWGSVFSKIAGVPVVISSRRDMGFNLKRRHRLAYRVINKLFDKIITVADAVKREIVKKEKVNPKKIVTIYNGVEIIENNHTDKLRIKKALGLDLDKYTITMLANISAVKGHKYLLAAASQIIKKNKSVQFLLVGKGENGYEQDLRLLADRLGIKDNIIFAGFRSNISEILSISDVSVLSSTSEGLSNAILEYMSAGNPVVATDAGGNRELVVDGVTGFLVPPQNPDALACSISKLLEDKNLRQEMGANGRERAEVYFSKEKMVRDIEFLFDKMLIKKMIMNSRNPYDNIFRTYIA